jgi:hypothetical protein
MRAHEKRRGLFSATAFDQLDLTRLGKLGDCRFGAREQPDLETAQSKIRGSGAPAVSGTQNSDLTYSHETVCRHGAQRMNNCRGAACRAQNRDGTCAASGNAVMLQLVFV